MKNKLISFILLVIFLSLLFNPILVINSVADAINTFIYKLFPAVFPYLLITDLLITYDFYKYTQRYLNRFSRKIFHVDGVCSFIIMFSILSGFPSGVKYIRKFLDKGLIDIDTANYLIVFTNYSNPLFILGTVFLIIRNKHITYLILFSHILSNLIIGYIIRPKTTKFTCYIDSFINDNNFSTNLTNSTIDTFKLMLIILGNSIFFYIVSALINKYIPGNYSFLIDGIFDLTKGINTLSNINFSIYFKAVLILSFISFSGINVHLQVLNIIKNTKIRYSNFLLGRVCQVAIAILIFIILINFH